MAIRAPPGGRWDPNSYPSSVSRNKLRLRRKRNTLHPRQSMTNHMELLLPERSTKDEGKMTVVLDMDETLLHSVFMEDSLSLLGKLKGMAMLEEKDKDSIIQQHLENSDLVLNICGDTIGVKLRPGLQIFLRKLSKKFEVVLYTAADRRYAEPLLNQIDPHRKYLPHRLYREHTINYRGTKYIKDLSRLGRDLKKVVLIDNNMIAMRAFPNNSILVKDYYGDEEDHELETMWAILTEIRKLPDVRPTLISCFSIAKKIEKLLANPEAIKEPSGKNGSYKYKEIAQSF